MTALASERQRDQPGFWLHDGARIWHAHRIGDVSHTFGCRPWWCRRRLCSLRPYSCSDGRGNGTTWVDLSLEV